MYKCNDCGIKFRRFKEIEESRGEFWGIPCSETLYVCPNCEGDDIEELNGDEDDEDDDDDEYYDMIDYEGDKEDQYYDDLMAEMLRNQQETF